MNLFNAAATSLSLFAVSGVLFLITVSVLVAIKRSNDKIEELIKVMELEDDK